MKRLVVQCIPFLFVFGCTISPSPEDAFDRRTGQAPVLTHIQLDSVFDSFETVNCTQLPDGFVNYCALNGQFAGFYKSTSWYRINPDDLYRYFAGRFRICDLLPRDSCFYRCRILTDRPTYLLIDLRVVHKLLDMMLTLKEKGLRHDAFEIYHGFRHPRYNEEVGGASRSQHLYGRAIDIRIGDINGDKAIDRKDKEIVLDILEEDIIANSGGIGDYKGSMAIHLDLRGYRARWDCR